MLQEPVLIIRGVVSQLQMRQAKEEFLFSGSDVAAGRTAAVGLAIDGLAGEATGAALSVGNTAERVDFFVCKVGDRVVKGRFGKVNFANGDSVEVLGSSHGNLLEAYAVTRPSDRTIWMHPHCGRGSSNYKRYCVRAIASLSLGVPAVFVISLMIYSYAQEDSPVPLWFWLLVFVVGASILAAILTSVAVRFTKFARISDVIFTALGFDKPCDVDLHKRLHEASRTNHLDRTSFHPYARWVYKY